MMHAQGTKTITRSSKIYNMLAAACRVPSSIGPFTFCDGAGKIQSGNNYVFTYTRAWVSYSAALQLRDA